MFLSATLSFTGTTTRASQSFSCQTLSKVSAIVTATITGGTWSAKLQGSNDGSVWADLASATNLTTATPAYISAANVGAMYVRVVVLTGDAGTLSALSGTFGAKL